VIRRSLLRLSLLLLLPAAPILADDVQFTGTAAFADPLTGTSMSPYSGTLNGQAVEFICVDATTGLASTASWTATATALTNPFSYANTLQFQLTGSNSTAQTNYLEIAYLITQLLTNLDLANQADAAHQNSLETFYGELAAQDQWAIWSFTPPSAALGNPDPYGTNASLVATAQAAVQGGFTVSNWEILTPDSDIPGRTGAPGQEVIVVPTPEPATVVLLLAGALGLVALTLVRKHTRLSPI